MKKIVSLLLASILLVSLSNFVAASESDEANAIYIQTLDCPSDVLLYAAENASRFIMGMNEEFLLNLDEVRVGLPFSYGKDASNLFTFPIFEGENVIYTLRVAYSLDGELNGTISTFLADELNEYRGSTSYDTPLLFKIVGNALYACIGDNSEQVFEFTDNDAPSTIGLTRENKQASLKTYDVSNSIDFNASWIQVRDPSRYINLTLTETQPSNNNWCVAYATAAILRTQTGYGHTARTIMAWYYGDNVSESQMLPLNKAAEYSRIYGGLMDTTYTSSGLSNAKLMSQLDNIGPLLIDMTNRTDGGKSKHSVVLRGYSMGNSTWSIWNPVNINRYYESFSMGGDYVSTTGNVFYYNGNTIYNFY